jgi:hypothetical protein
MKKIFSTDIDGVLNNYPICWLNYIKQEIGHEYKSTEKAKESLGDIVYSQIKSKYRKSEYKENIAFSVEARSALIEISHMGFEIVAATSRPIIDPEFPDLKEMTARWLKKNLGFQIRVIHKNENADFTDNLTNLKYHIDDELKYAIPIAKKNIPTFLIDRNNNYITTNSKIQKISSFTEVISIIKNKINE